MRAVVVFGYYRHMAEAGREWTPTDDDLFNWRFLRLSGRPAVAWLCLDEGRAAMWARPRDPLMRQAFRARHAGHEHVFISELLDRVLEAKLDR